MRIRILSLPMLPMLPMLLICAGCHSAPPSSPATDSATSLAALRQLAAQSSCQSSQQCASIAVGAKACGGPEFYLAVATEKLEAARALAARHSAARRLENAATPDAQSDCRLVTDPGAQCSSGRCVAGDRAAVM